MNKINKYLLIIVWLSIGLNISPPIWAKESSVDKEERPKIRILIVPGHDKENYGSQFKKIKEANLTLALANRLLKLLKNNNRFETWITRDKLGYKTEFKNYFSENKQAIKDFISTLKSNYQESIISKKIVLVKKVPHANAKPVVVSTLFGINKWIDENKIDLVLHIHFNDYPRKKTVRAGKYTGFTVYYPEKQLINHEISAKIANHLFKDLKKKFKPSNYKKENGGLVEDQVLIAMGTKQSLNSQTATILIEYGYIYEPKFQKEKTLDQLALITYQSLINYFK
ncbi:N-acetylmuramoyl-L-alanine amidase [Candidatus Azambacteria bacterium]|nr:N-acetylmuramoyl-L-alanine amidase [Candidatus Azambacteria bacterium]